MAKKSNTEQTLTQVLKETITKSGKSLLQIANASGVSQPILSRFMNGERSITLQTADKLAKYFGLNLK